MECHPFAAESINIRRGYVFGSERGVVSSAEIVRQDDNDVRRRLGDGLDE